MERERERERERDKERMCVTEREREKVNIIYTVCAPYSIYCIHVHKLYTLPTIVRKREREGESFVVVVALKKAG